MKRTSVLTAIIIVMAAMVMGCAMKKPGGSGKMAPPGPGTNVLLITIDTLRADQLGYYGQEITKTPAMDALAGEGVAFKQAFPTVPFTVPSIYSIMTSRYPFDYSMGSGLPMDMGKFGHETLVQMLKRDGYLTAAVSGSHVLHGDSGLGLWFDEFVDSGDKAMLPSGDTAESTLEIMDRLAKTGNKFFVWTHFMDPHGPFTPPGEFDLYRDIANDPLMKLTDEWPEEFRDHLKESNEKLGYGRTLEVSLPSAYRGEVTYTDHCVSLLLAKLEELGIADETLVILTADHGTTFGLHDLYLGYAFTLYQDVARVPLIFRFPGFDAGKMLEEPVSLLDIMPTILDIAGAGTNELVMEGVSLAPALKGEEPLDEKRTIFSQTLGFRDQEHADQKKVKFTGETVYRHSLLFDRGQWTMAAIRNFKLISVPTPDGTEYELYNMNMDPGEQRNVSEKKEDIAVPMSKSINRFINKKKTAKGKSGAAPKDADKESMKRMKSLGYIE